MSRKQRDTVGSIGLWFDFSFGIDVCTQDDGDASYHRTMTSDISFASFDEETGRNITETIGYVEVWHIEGSRAFDAGVDIIDYCDSVDGELLEYASAIYLDDMIDETICECPVSNDVLVLHRIEINKKFRGREYGLAVFRTICERLGYNCGAILIKPGPLQFSPISRSSEWQEKYDTSVFASNEKEATAKLRKYWDKLGLRETREASVYCIIQD